MRFKILLAILLLIGYPAYGEPACSVRISPVGFVSGKLVNLHITTRIQHNDTNRSATVELVSEDYYSRSDFDVEGSKAPITRNFDIRDLGAGTYVVYLTLHQLVGGKWREVTAQSERLMVLD